MRASLFELAQAFDMLGPREPEGHYLRIQLVGGGMELLGDLLS